MNNTKTDPSVHAYLTILPPLIPRPLHKGRDPRNNYHIIEFPITPLKPNPWAYTFPFESPHLENVLNTYANDTIGNVMRGLMAVRTGAEFGLEWFMETNRDGTFKNGNPRKYPIIKREWMYRCISREKKRPADVDFAAGPDFLRKTAMAAMRETALLVDTQHARTFWNGRARLIDAMLDPDVSLEITTTWNAARRRIDFQYRWLPDNVRINTGYRTSLLINEVMQFLPTWMLLDLDYHLDDFKWVFRHGFVDELHCPEMYWERMKYRITSVRVNDLIPVPVEGKAVPDWAYVTWFNPPLQPINTVVLTGGEVIYPQEWTYENLKDAIDPRLERAVKESYEITKESPDPD